MRYRRRDLPEASLSFLDVISCGFGAIVLLLIIARVGDPSALEEAEKELQGSVKELQTQLFDIRGESVFVFIIQNLVDANGFGIRFIRHYKYSLIPQGNQNVISMLGVTCRSL